MIGRVLLAVGFIAQVAAAAPLSHSLTRWSTPATQPGTKIEEFTASDLPLDFMGAAGDAQQRLKAFDLPIQRFQYSLQLVEDSEDVQIYRLVFPSPLVSQFPENNTVPAEYFVPRNHDQKLPAAVVLDIMQGNALVPRGLARGLAAQGVAAVYMPMAYYGSRKPKDNAHTRWLEEDPSRAGEPTRQTVMDIRRLKAILAGRPEVDPARIGITGVSLGGIMTSIAAGVDGHFYRIVPILAGGNLAEMMFTAPETRKIRAILLEKGIDQQKLAPIMAPVEPLNFASRIDSSRCLMINASKDEVILKDCTMQLWRAIGEPTLLWLPSGHYGAAWYLPTIKQTAIDFLKGKPVKKLEY